MTDVAEQVWYFCYTSSKLDSTKKNLKLDNYRGEFDLLEFKNLKNEGDVKIYGHGTHPLLDTLKKLKIEHLMRGHVIETKSPRVAMRIKFNPQSLIKAKLTVANAYGPIDTHEFETEIAKAIATRYDNQFTAMIKASYEAAVRELEWRKEMLETQYEKGSQKDILEQRAKVVNSSNDAVASLRANIKSTDELHVKYTKIMETAQQEAVSYFTSKTMTL